MIPPAAKLFDRLGGVRGVARLVEEFYAHVLADPLLRPHFAGVELSKLRRMQFEFFCAALGGPTAYSGRTVRQAHHGLGISRGHIEAFVAHLFETLRGFPLAEEERGLIVARIRAYAGDVVEVDASPPDAGSGDEHGGRGGA
jgi:hemoglobin